MGLKHQLRQHATPTHADYRKNILVLHWHVIGMRTPSPLVRMHTDHAPAGKQTAAPARQHRATHHPGQESRKRYGLATTTLAHWVARRQVLCLQWNGEVWLPLFQFEYQYMTVKPTLEPVFAALNPVLSPWKLANWCAQPHCELDGENPANALSTSAAQVLRAACADSLALH